MPFGRRKFSTRNKKSRKSTQLVRDRAILATMPPLEVAPTEPSQPLPPRLSPGQIVNYAEDSTDDDDDENIIVPPVSFSAEVAFKAASSTRNIRLAIAVLFEVVLGSPPSEEWKERKTVPTIMDMFDQRKKSFGKKIRNVCRDVLQCQEDEIPYDPVRKYKNSGRKPIIAVDSVEAEIIADAIESGNSIKMASHIANKYREEKGRDSLTLSAVTGCFHRLRPEIKPLKRGKQGSMDIASAWCQASFRWFAQLQLCFGLITFEHKMFEQLLGANYNKTDPPDCYNIRKLPKYKLTKIAWFDETHKKCHIGESGSRIGAGRDDLSICFQRDDKGKLDLKNGNYAKRAKRVLNCKYEKESRLCFGVFLGVVNGVEVGQKIEKVFNYSEKKIITWTDGTKARLQQMKIIQMKKGRYQSLCMLSLFHRTVPYSHCRLLRFRNSV